MDELKNMSFETALRELETIVRRMENGESPLEQSIQDYAKGMALKAYCESKLAEARMKVEKVVQGEAGQKTLAPFDSE